MTEMQSLFFYLLVFFISTVFVYLGGVKRYSRRLSGLFVLTGIAIPAVVSGIRYGVGIDYNVYLSIYNDIVDRSVADILFNSNGTEVLFGLISLASKTLFDNPIPMLVLYSLMTIGFFYAGIKKLQPKYPWLLYCLFLLVVFPLSLNIMKQALSVSIIFFALSCAMNREIRKSLLLTSLAVLSHTSAVIAVPFIIIISAWQRSLSEDASVRLFMKYSALLVFLGLAFYLAVPFVIDNGVVDKYSSLYGSGGYYASSEASPLRILLKILILGIILLFYKHFYKKISYFNVFLLFILSELLILIIGLSSAPISRISLYLLPYTLVVLSGLPSLFAKGISERTAVLGVVLFGIVYFVLLYYIQRGSGIFPYNFWYGV